MLEADTGLELDWRGQSSQEWADLAARCRTETGRVLRDPHDADEAAQEALVRAWRYRDSLREAEARGPWVATIARNAALNYQTRRAQTQALERIDAAALEQGRDDPNLSAVLDALALEGLLAPLGSLERDLLRLRFVEDLTYAEVADRLGMPVGTIKVRLHRLRDRLKSLIEKGKRA